jgi:hypothetical protein
MKRILLLLAMLCWILPTGCSTAPIVKTEYVKAERPTIPAKPELYKVVFAQEGLCYCLDETNLRNLLKNITLMFGYQEELEKGWE